MQTDLRKYTRVTTLQNSPELRRIEHVTHHGAQQMSAPARTVRSMAGWFVVHRLAGAAPRDGYWLSSMPMCCPGCGLDWNADGISLPYRANVDRCWSGSAVFYECLGCGWRAVDDRKGEYRRSR